MKVVLSNIQWPFSTHALNFWRWFLFFLGALFIFVLIRYGIVFTEQKLWLDDILTISLIQAPDLKTLWRGIILGIDGNPPEYLSLAFLATHFFAASQAAFILRTANLVVTAIGFLALYRMARRFASPVVCLFAIMTVISFSNELRFAALGMRTYPLYLALDAICLLLLLRWIEGETILNWVMLTLGLTALSMTHTLAIAYVMSIAVGNALAALLRGQRGTAIASLGCAVPAAMLFAAWLPSLILQTEVGRPYGWIMAPHLRSLASNALPQIVSIGMLMFAVKFLSYREKPWRYWLDRLDFRVTPFLIIAILEMCFTIFVILFSIAVYPVFVPRYLIPNIIITYFILAAALHLIEAFLPWRGMLIGATVALLVINVVKLALKDPHREKAGPIPGLDEKRNVFLEDEVVTNGLPIVVESPHAWFPRRYYEQSQYIFPLDWDVVERYPWKAHNNATDFHIMQRFRNWANTDGIMTTKEIFATYSEFLVLQEDSRAWFENLNQTKSFEKQNLARGQGCKLWRVKVKVPDSDPSIGGER